MQWWNTQSSDIAAVRKNLLRPATWRSSDANCNVGIFRSVPSGISNQQNQFQIEPSAQTGPFGRWTLSLNTVPETATRHDDATHRILWTHATWWIIVFGLTKGWFRYMLNQTSYVQSVRLLSEDSMESSSEAKTPVCAYARFLSAQITAARRPFVTSTPDKKGCVRRHSFWKWKTLFLPNQITRLAETQRAKRKGNPFQLSPVLSMIAWMTLGPIIDEARLERPKRPKNWWRCQTISNTGRYDYCTILSKPGGVNSAIMVWEKA